MGELSGAIRALVLCPNECGVLYELCKEVEHKSVCPNEILACKYLKVGCTATFKRADEEGHYENCSIMHNEMVAKLSQSIFQDLDDTRRNLREEMDLVQQKLKEQDEMIRKLHEDLEKKSNERENLIQKLNENLRIERERSDKQEETISDLRQENEKYKEDIKSLNDRIQRLEVRLAELEKKRAQEIKHERSLISFSLDNYTERKRNSRPWASKIFTTNEGYNFCIQIHANGLSESCNKAISVGAAAIKGENDATLKWPLEASLILTLCKTMPEVEDKIVIEHVEWQRPEEAEVKDPECLTCFTAEPFSQFPKAFIHHSKVKSYLDKDRLNFKLSVSHNQ